MPWLLCARMITVASLGIPLLRYYSKASASRFAWPYSADDIARKHRDSTEWERRDFERKTISQTIPPWNIYRAKIDSYQFLSTKYAHICLAYKWLRQNSSAFYPASTCLRHVSWASIIILTVFPGHKLVCYQPSSIGYGMQLATIAGPLYGLLCAFACSFISKHIRSPINFVGFRQKSSILGSIFFWYLWALGMVHTAKVYSHSAWVGS